MSTDHLQKPALSAAIVLLAVASCTRLTTPGLNAATARDEHLPGAADAGVDKDAQRHGAAGPECPAREPVRGDACHASGRRCAYGARRDCGTVWDCFRGFWDPIASVACEDRHRGHCPESPSPAAPANVSRNDALQCVYPDGTICTFRYPKIDQRCSGVKLPIVAPAIPSWSCAPADAPCQRNDLEGRCSPEGMHCGPSCCGMGFECRDGKWAPVPHPCPP